MPPLERILIGHYNKIQKMDQENFKCVISNDNIKEWYVLVYGLEYPYTGGEYLFKIIMNDYFPDIPPSLRALTPNGVFTADGEPICTEIGEFHSKLYRSGLGIYGFILNSIIGIMLTSPEGEHGIRFEVEPEEVRERYAQASKAYNDKHYPDVISAVSAPARTFL